MRLQDLLIDFMKFQEASVEFKKCLRRSWRGFNIFKSVSRGSRGLERGREFPDALEKFPGVQERLQGVSKDFRAPLENS